MRSNDLRPVDVVIGIYGTDEKEPPDGKSYEARST
jgi:hypothetical protein